MTLENFIGRGLTMLGKIAWPLSALLSLGGAALLFNKIAQADRWPDHDTDLSVYLDAARAVTSGANMYDSIHYQADVYGYPPLFAEIIAVARLLLGDGLGWIAWMLLSALALFLSFAMMMRGFGVRLGWKWVSLIFSVFIAGYMTRTDLFHMQPHFFLLLLIVIGLKLFADNRIVRGGISWALIFVIKPFTGVMIFWLMRRGEWRAVIATLAAATAMFVASFAPFWRDPVGGVKDWMAASGFHTGWPNVAKSANETFYGLFNRMFGPETNHSLPWVEAPYLVPLLSAPFLILAAVGIFMSVSNKDETLAIPAGERGAQDMVQIATVLGFSMSCGPLMEAPHCYMLLPGLVGSVMLAATRWREQSPTRWRWVWAAAAWASTFSWLVFPVGLPIIDLYRLGQVSGPTVLLTLKLGFFVLASCLLTAFALLGDRAARRSRVSSPIPLEANALRAMP